jgi:hypothetical protein
MNVAVESAQYIEGEKLTTWSVLPGGGQVCLGFAAIDGETHHIVLPFEALTGLLMTLPRMLQSALDERFPDSTLRVVHPLGDWRLEQTEGNGGLILKLATRDGFEVAFALPDEDAGSLGTALLTTAEQPTSTLTRRPN